jgi:hypothetical protein
MKSETAVRFHKRGNSLELLQYAKRFQEKFILHQFWTDSSMGKKIEKISDVADVDIAEAGCFKYILIEVQDLGSNYGQSKLVVRGDASCAFHGMKKNFHSYLIYLIFLADVLDIMENQIDEKKLTLDCKGGGRIRVNPQTRTISVYGYSQVIYKKNFEKNNKFFFRVLVVLIMKKQWKFSRKTIHNGQ